MPRLCDFPKFLDDFSISTKARGEYFFLVSYCNRLEVAYLDC